MSSEYRDSEYAKATNYHNKDCFCKDCENWVKLHLKECLCFKCGIKKKEIKGYE